jgi:hypothetical protein
MTARHACGCAYRHACSADARGDGAMRGSQVPGRRLHRRQRHRCAPPQRAQAPRSLGADLRAAAVLAHRRRVHLRRQVRGARWRCAALAARLQRIAMHRTAHCALASHAAGTPLTRPAFAASGRELHAEAHWRGHPVHGQRRPGHQRLAGARARCACRADARALTPALLQHSFFCALFRRPGWTASTWCSARWSRAWTW